MELQCTQTFKYYRNSFRHQPFAFVFFMSCSAQTKLFFIDIMAKLLKVPQIDVGMEVLHLNLVQGQFFHTLFPSSFFTFALSIQSALNMWNVAVGALPLCKPPLSTLWKNSCQVLPPNLQRKAGMGNESESAQMFLKAWGLKVNLLCFKWLYKIIIFVGKTGIFHFLHDWVRPDEIITVCL